MNTTPLAAVVGLLFFLLVIEGCKNRKTAEQNTVPENNSAAYAQKPAVRDPAITPATAYSDLFLDSSRLDSFIVHQKLTDAVAGSMRDFYRSRNYELAWFASDGPTEQALLFYSLYNYSKDSSSGRKWLDKKLDSLLSQDSLTVSADDPWLPRTEFLMTWRFINYLGDRYSDPGMQRIALLDLIPARKKTPLKMAEEILAEQQLVSRPPNSWFDGLVDQLKTYTHLLQVGGLDSLPQSGKKLRKGDSSPYISLLKDRLRQTESFDASDTSVLFDANLEKAIKTYQIKHGLEPDGRPGPSLVRELNVPVATRVRQLLINYERIRWLPDDVQSRMILVNIPEFRLHVLDGGGKVFDMNIVVGKEGHSTVLFSGHMDRVTFNPYWNIPPSIVKKEILPGIQRNKDYLAAHDMEITGNDDGLPIVRQRPGTKNELGRIKFLFPNSFNIYLHDSPHKELFNMRRRAYSHGCIRVADAPKLANYLLGENPDWDSTRMDSIFAASKEETIRLQQPVPVLICYLTCWDNGEFREDIYGHDKVLEKKLFL